MINNINKIVFNSGFKRFYTSYDNLGRNFLKNYKDVKSLYSPENIYKKITDDNKKLLENIKSENTIYLSKLITKVESTRDDHQEQSRYIISYLQSLQQKEKNEDKNKTYRIGITGPPGAGKSTFIESFGKHLTSLGNKVAVLAIDPSSIRTGGSIMGDKTRMQQLSVDPNAYVRPSATRGFLGGITKGTSDTIVLCESAGFNIIIVETVGVGQSEVSIEHLVDVFCLIVPPANGDELQGLKKGISELADLVVVNKADGDLLPKARFTVSEYLSAFKIQRPKNLKWIPRVLSCSSVTKEHIDNVWNEMLNFKKVMMETGDFTRKRAEQKELFMKKLIEEELSMMLLNNEEVQKLIPYFETQVRDGIISPSLASNEIIKTFMEYERNKKEEVLH
ncbi:hypothetical protein DICPUDRAFT_75901 [Dictyostelium purpureum]|uniref:AAA+ ATPase domain-containing protein n=1 Tax=Dictyostelium purpureum TaxID=5786 RepID=F0ZC03_DICPU|nr:uncharacterized protein DICPUDRAFT_75901 [Dictyostelium purpureum]EGC38549.1 hypothetical protein DICPUDRAFT_75901 [Dictyostelium purpureum]|eukprot:XP_003284920.1 hypothetical protein DICPUDRAFT_75901 [Dictyostelium purpureum]